MKKQIPVAATAGLILSMLGLEESSMSPVKRKQFRRKMSSRCYRCGKKKWDCRCISIKQRQALAACEKET